VTYLLAKIFDELFIAAVSTAVIAVCESPHPAAYVRAPSDSLCCF
jgi:hypothetical protein